MKKRRHKPFGATIYEANDRVRVVYHNGEHWTCEYVFREDCAYVPVRLSLSCWTGRYGYADIRFHIKFKIKKSLLKAMRKFDRDEGIESILLGEI